MGKMTPESIHKERATHGLQLSRGPDPRSKGGSGEAAVHEIMRKALGLPE
jgi:hypothetical protein